MVHGVALAILLWPLAGIAFVPMVDLPGHLAITRVLDDFLHGKYRASLQLNLNPIHKPTYLLLYALFAVLPKAAVGPVAIALMVAAFYAAIGHAIAVLGRRDASSPLVASLAVLVGMFCYASMFFWGLLPFLLSIPPALVAYVCYLRASGIVDAAAAGTRSQALRFVAAALLAHVVHPLASLFLGIMLGAAAAAGGLLALVPSAAGGTPVRARLRSIAWPLVAWVSGVAVVQLCTAPAGQGHDLARSVPALAAPFHGVVAARTFLAQIPVELGMLPTRTAVSTFVRFPIAVAMFFAVAMVLAFVGSHLAGRATERAGGPDGGAALRLATVLVVSVAAVLFLRHDIIRPSVRLLWFPVRAPGFLVFFFGVLAAAILVRSLSRGRAAGVASAVVTVAGLALAAERSAVLRVHFVAFDQTVQGFFRGEVPDRVFRSQPFSYADHIRVYNCLFDAACNDQSPLFFAIYPDDATIYPVSRIRKPPGDDDRRPGGEP